MTLKSYSSHDTQNVLSSFLNPFLSFSITKQIKMTLIQRHELHMSRVISQLIKTEGAKKRKVHKGNLHLMLWTGRFDSEHHYVLGFAFHANRFSKPGSSLLMALPIKLEAHPNTNIPQYIGFVTSNPLSSYRGNYNNVLFLHGIRHRPLWRASHNRCFAVVSTDHWSPNELNEQSLYMY